MKWFFGVRIVSGGKKDAFFKWLREACDRHIIIIVLLFKKIWLLEERVCYFGFNATEVLLAMIFLVPDMNLAIAGGSVNFSERWVLLSIL